jgi:hypothetical protein
VTERVPGLQDAARWLCGPPPENATDPCLAFLSNEHRFSHFLVAPLQMAQQIDGQSDHLANQSNDSERRIAMFLEEYSDLVAEMVLTRTTDDFLTYVSHLMKLLFQLRPEILQTTVQVRLADVLRFPDKDLIVQHAIDDYVRKLSYQSLGDLYRDIKDRTAFKLFTSEALRNTAMEAVAIRNVLVHNNGTVDAHLAGLIPRYRGQEGQRVADFDAIDFRNQLILAVIDIDQRARNKWGLPKGSGKVPHLCHRFDSLLSEAELPTESNPPVIRDRMRTGPDCRRCHRSTVTCEVCKGNGKVAFTFGLCTECAGTGWVCPQDGRHWQG